MTSKESIHTTETADLQKEIPLQFIPSDLAQTNSQIGIFNQIEYDNMAAAFSPRMYQPIQVVKIGISDTSFIWGVRDGHTRLKYAVDHQFPLIEAFDVTDDIIHNPRIVQDITEGKTTLTPTEYLLSVVEPTNVHQDIASARIGMHLLNTWKYLPHETTQDEISPLTVFHFLVESRMWDYTTEKIVKKLQKEKYAFTEDQLQAISARIIETNQLVQQFTTANKKEVFSAMIWTIVTNPNSVGGVDEAICMLKNMLHQEQIDKKLHSTDDYEGNKQRLASCIYNALVKSQPDIRYQPLSRMLHQIVNNSSLSMKETLTILQAENPFKTYYEMSRTEDSLLPAEQPIRNTPPPIIPFPQEKPITEQDVQREVSVLIRRIYMIMGMNLDSLHALDTQTARYATHLITYLLGVLPEKERGEIEAYMSFLKNKES